MKKILLTALAALILTAAGCSTAMVPVGTNATAPGTMKVDIIVGQSYPSFDRSDPYTPIHVTLRNNTDMKIPLKYAYFTLVDPVSHTFTIAPVRQVVNWVRHERWRYYYAPYYPSPVGEYVFREGNLLPHGEYDAVMFFHQAARYGQGVYTLRAAIPQNGAPVEFTFRLK